VEEHELRDYELTLFSDLRLLKKRYAEIEKVSQMISRREGWWVK